MRRRDHIDHAMEQNERDELAAFFDRVMPEDGPTTWPMNSNRLVNREVSDPGNTKQKDHSHEGT